MKRLIAAIDTPDPAAARAMIHDIAPACGMIKLGLEFFMANGPAGLAVAGDMPVFLDMKLHDIPNTVAGAVRSLSRLRIAMLSIHAGGGSAMIAAAREAAGNDPARPKILAVTVLTSFDEAGLAATGVRGGTAAQVENLAALALAAGADGLVCSPHEVALLRRRFGAGPILVVPGIRPAGAALGDQARVMSPEQAVHAGADYVVVGRPITQAENPAMAAQLIAEAMA